MAKIFRLKKGQLEFTSKGIIIEDKYLNVNFVDDLWRFFLCTISPYGG